jgi:CubicO group peptidase (beta-lactamase class C family)
VNNITVQGFCDSRFDAVKEAFIDNFKTRQELGASVALCLEGEYVVDLWAGYMDEQRTIPWQRDTLVNVWSVGKAVTAVATLKALQMHGISIDDPVCKVWSEFASQGKDDITFAMAMSHQAGLCAIEKPLPADAFFHWDLMQNALAEQRPFWEPGTKHGYHTNTFGFLLGEPVRRITGMHLNEFMQQEVASPLGIDVHFGVPQSELSRCADLVQMPRPAEARAIQSSDVDDPWNSMRQLIYNNPPLFPLGINSDAWRMSEFPSTSPQSNARSVAKLMSTLATIVHSRQDGLLNYDLLNQAVQIYSDGEDLNLMRPTRFGLGFQISQPIRPFGANPGNFGHFGNGGHVGFADPTVPLGFAYNMNHQGHAWRDPRNIALTDAVYSSL